MRALSGKDIHYRDSLASRRRQLFRMKLFGLLFLLFLIAGGGGYALFFTPLLEVRDIKINGLEPDQREAVLAYIYEVMAGRSFSRLELNKNILVFDAEGVVQKFLTEMPVLMSATAKKKAPHTVVFDFTQREALGVWCFGDDCEYFDENGKTWGQAAKSSGFLLLTVEDLRQNQDKVIGPEILTAINTIAEAAPQLGIRIKRIVIPAEFFNELKVVTNKGYYLLMGLDSNITEQLSILRTLLEKKRDDKNFGPSYIDLRIDGRIYYK